MGVCVWGGGCKRDRERNRERKRGGEKLVKHEYEFEPRKVSNIREGKGCVALAEESDLIFVTPFELNRIFTSFPLADEIENEWAMR